MASHLKRVPARQVGPLRLYSARQAQTKPMEEEAVATQQPARRKRKRRRRRPSRLQDAAAQGVSTAYCVVEEYMRRGYEAAHRYESAIHQESTMGYYDRHSGCERDGWNPMEAMMAPMIQMTRAWLDTVSCFVPGVGGMGSAWSSRRGGSSCGCGASYGGSCRCQDEDSDRCPCGCGAFSWMGCRGGARSKSGKHSRSRRRAVLHIDSRRAAEGCLDLQGDADEYRIEVDDLTYTDEDGQAFTAKTHVSHHSSGKTFVRVKVPGDAPAGEYRGDVYCGDRRCGEVCVTVYDDGSNGGDDDDDEQTHRKDKYEL